MIRLHYDYNRGACAKILEKLAETNAESYDGYGEDTWCEKAADLIRKKCKAPEAAVHFFPGATQANFIVHAPYIINLANTVKPETYELASTFLAKEIERTAAMGATVLVLHPGAHVGAGAEAGIAQICKGLNEVLNEDTPVFIALETMAGKGTEIGRSFEELKAIYDGCNHPDKLRVCFDTCHVNDAGYDLVNDYENVMKEFDKIIGLDQIAAFHINDSKNPLGAAKDRHENFGKGYLGSDALMQVIRDSRFETIPKILETPYIKDPENPKKSTPPYKEEIAWIKKQLMEG